MKHLVKKIGQNIAILVTAFLCALAIFSITKNPNLFLSSVLSLQEQQFITTKNRDAAYKTQSGVFEIFLAPKYTNTFTAIETNIYFKKWGTQIQTENLSGKGTLHFQKISDDGIKITLKDIPQIDTSNEIVSIAFSWEEKWIVLGETKGMSGNQRINLSVGNLNESNEHSNK